MDQPRARLLESSTRFSALQRPSRNSVGCGSSAGVVSQDGLDLSLRKPVWHSSHRTICPATTSTEPRSDRHVYVRRRARITASTPVPATARGRSSATSKLPHIGIERSDRGLDRDLHLTCRGRGSSGAGIDRAVSNKEQGPSRSDAVRHPPHHVFHGAGHVDVQANNEIVTPRLHRPRREIALDPVDALCDIGPSGRGHRPPVSQRRCREVHRRDLPAMRGEPERVCAMSTAGVEGASRRKVGRLGHQMRVWWTVRDLVAVLAQRLRPQLLPEGLIECWLCHGVCHQSRCRGQGFKKQALATAHVPESSPCVFVLGREPAIAVDAGYPTILADADSDWRVGICKTRNNGVRRPLTLAPGAHQHYRDAEFLLARVPGPSARRTVFEHERVVLWCRSKVSSSPSRILGHQQSSLDLLFRHLNGDASGAARPRSR